MSDRTESEGPRPPRNRKVVENAMNWWRNADEFIIQQLEEGDALRTGYEQAVETVATRLRVVPSLDALIAGYFADDKDEYKQEITQAVKEACATFRPEGNRELKPHLVENAAYHRRGKELLAQWWSAEEHAQSQEYREADAAAESAHEEAAKAVHGTTTRAART